jgi:uncharacterized protein YuzE
MEINYDKEADALYIKLGAGDFASNKKIDNWTLIDLDAKGRVIGIEFLEVSTRLPPEAFSEVHLKNLVLARSSV